MAKTHPYLKGLAETRARVAGDLARYQTLAEAYNAKLAQAKTELEACDWLIRNFDLSLVPSRIEPVHTHGAYGKRGALKAAIVKRIRAHGIPGILSSELYRELETMFGLNHPTGAARKKWCGGVVRRRLLEMEEAGFIFEE